MSCEKSANKLVKNILLKTLASQMEFLQKAKNIFSKHILKKAAFTLVRFT